VLQWENLSRSLPALERKASVVQYFIARGTDGEAYASAKLLQTLIAREARRRYMQARPRDGFPLTAVTTPAPVRLLVATPAGVVPTALSHRFVHWGIEHQVLSQSTFMNADDASRPLVFAILNPAAAPNVASLNDEPKWSRFDCEAWAAWERCEALVSSRRQRQDENRGWAPPDGICPKGSTVFPLRWPSEAFVAESPSEPT